MSQFLSSLESEIQSRGLLPRGAKVLVAVSGGVDSLVLLHALHLLAGKHGWKIFVAHFNHQLRGRASDADEKLVRRAAAVLKLPIAVESAEVKAFAQKSKFSIEMAARKLRHEFFARTAKQQKSSIVALAHHADDQVELFFLRVLRGAGGEGLAGMKWRSPSPVEHKLTLVRPLLACTKAGLRAFARESKIRFREDATNTSADFLRNRIRHELSPLLQTSSQPGLAKTILRLMEIVGAESDFVGEAAQQWLSGRGRASAQNKSQSLLTSTATIEKHSFASLSVAVQRKVVQRQLLALGVAADFELIEPLRKTPDHWVSVRAGWSVARDGAGKVRLQEQFEAQFQADELAFTLQGRAGQVELGGKEICWRLTPAKKFVRPQSQTGGEVFDADQIGNELILRHWRAGDRFQPLGLPSPVKLQDLFVNAKIPRARRHELVVATTRTGEIFWVEGLRMSERFKLTAATRCQLVWKWS